MFRSGGQSGVKPPGFSPQESFVFTYRPSEGMKGLFDLAQPGDRTPDLWCGSAIRYHSATGILSSRTAIKFY
ncbi:hypothetical protein TNCV_5023821 [Trichonephila clavipes]|nr:hypothetical protein TNCV_5023821 [Trichonephila clavipes]